jgi:hypothetical protein
MISSKPYQRTGEFIKIKEFGSISKFSIILLIDFSGSYFEYKYLFLYLTFKIEKPGPVFSREGSS